PEAAGMDSGHLSQVDQAIQEAIDEEQTPGAVLLILRDGAIVYRKAYGLRQIVDGEEPATEETIYDLASLTKPVATATAVMQLLEQGKLRLMDPVSKYLPEFESWHDQEQGQVSTIRIRHLMTHTSGLPSYPPVNDLLELSNGESTRDTVFDWLDHVERDFAPGEDFQYSCPNFVTLQRIVESITGMSLDEYTREHIFGPLKMEKTGYNPPDEWIPQTAPTGILDTGIQQVCTVHDPFARDLMEGVSGNAGLFSTADDLARFSAMLLNEGELDGIRILSPASIRALRTVPRGLETFGRGLGWDLYSPYSSNQGDLMGDQTFGHTGFTGTSLTIDPESRTAIIFLSNRVYPVEGQGSVVRLRSIIANIVASSILGEPGSIPSQHWADRTETP
ncbi:MAG: serine hydrolase domain-containing protein, partial [Bacteroidota bacterium]